MQNIALQPGPQSYGPPHQQQSQHSDFCYYCSGQHTLNLCDIVNTYVANGKIVKDSSNCIKLPGGSEIPCNLPGSDMSQ
jgi:hypothetical protein